MEFCTHFGLIVFVVVLASENNLEEPTKDVISLISHAVQERLKTLVEKLGVIAEHRLDIIRVSEEYFFII